MYLTRNEKNAEITYLLVGYFKNWQLYKGQLISKCLFGFFNSPKKRTKLAILSKEEAQDSEFHLFLGELRTT